MENQQFAHLLLCWHIVYHTDYAVVRVVLAKRCVGDLNDSNFQYGVFGGGSSCDFKIPFKEATMFCTSAYFFHFNGNGLVRLVHWLMA